MPENYEKTIKRLPKSQFWPKYYKLSAIAKVAAAVKPDQKLQNSFPYD